MRPGNVSYRQAEKTGCLKAGSTLKLFSKKFCFAILMKLRTTATIKLLVFVSGYYLPPMNCSSLHWWLLRPNGNTLLFSWWLLRPKGEKGLLSATSETADKKEETFEFSNFKGLYAWMNLSGELFESFWFTSFWDLIFSFISLEKVFSVYTTQLTRCAASSMQNENKISVNVGFS